MVEQPQPTSRRFRERQRRTRRQRRVNTVGTLVTLAVVVLVVLVATDTWRVGGRGPTLASGKTKVATTTSPSPSNALANLRHTNPPRPLSHAAPLRLWVGGDSLAGDLGYQLGPMVAKTGIVTAHVDYKVSSGIASNNVRNWTNEFTNESPRYQPEAVVFMVGANDASIVGSATDVGSNPPWEATYRDKVDSMMNLLVGSEHRTVFWIGSPTMGTKYDKGAQALDQVMREEAAKRPTVVYVDAYALFSENGVYSAYLDDATGQRVRMRTGDGVHFTVVGAEFLAEKVYKLLDSRWNLTTQSELTSPIPYTIEPSSGTIGGVHLSNHYSTTTTAPTATTAAPTTTQPTATTAAPTTTAPKTTTTRPSPTTTA